ncbi:MAG TPA: glycosyl hydrolase [Streptosporangiaceae bacterium]|nr:glycosyl hydrolase [Streptosporangiaceae bacterium]
MASPGSAPPNTSPRYPAQTLAPARGALFGAWVQPLDTSVVNAEEAAVASFERTIGRKLAIDHIYTPWTGPMPVEVARWDLRHGTIPMISWAAARSDLIAAGHYDSLIRATAREMKALHGPVMLRWFPEMDLRPNRHDSISPASFIAAWRHMHAIFAAAGATNVRWVWCPNISAFREGTAQSYYPGNSYVDWIGADGYNWAPQVTFLPWRSFAEIFGPFYSWGLPTGKPMLIGEFGAVEGSPGVKAGWFRQADRQIKTEFPALRAVVYFNSDHLNFGQYFNWRVTSSKSALEGFKAFANDPYFEAKPAT